MLNDFVKAECDKIEKMGNWLNTHGYSFDLKDPLWMEQYMGEFKLVDIIDLMHDYHKDMTKQRWINTAKELGFTH